ncbi:MAG: hypothetical protein R3208_13125 [Ketobacteraceae bacterium]|nr:hypothetical protein [Ketobacteraceae bacterium]
MHRLESEIKLLELLIEVGATAAKAGKALSANPHSATSPEYHAWRAGWFRHVNSEQALREDQFA